MYYTQDVMRRPVVSYSFGLYHDPQGVAHFLSLARVLALKLDLDRKPASWDQHLEGEGIVIDLHAAVTPMGVIRAWGSPDMPQTRKANSNFPLLFTVTGTIKQAGQARKVRGEGLAEYIARAS